MMSSFNVKLLCTELFHPFPQQLLITKVVCIRLKTHFACYATVW